jgi:hypothetical protein
MLVDNGVVPPVPSGALQKQLWNGSNGNLAVSNGDADVSGDLNNYGDVATSLAGKRKDVPETVITGENGGSTSPALKHLKC